MIAVAAPVLRHRIKTSFHADAEGITPDELVRRLVSHVSDRLETQTAHPSVDRMFKDPSSE